MRPVAPKIDRPGGDVALLPLRSSRRPGVLDAALALVAIMGLGLPCSVDPGATNVMQASADAATPDPAEPLTGVAWTELTAVEPVPEQPAVAASAPEEAVPEAPPPPDPCADALAWAEAAGLPLPPGVGYHCPSTQFAHHGAACSFARPCPGEAYIAINLDLIGGASPEYLRHVVAHEVCHILDFQAGRRTTEPGADACAAAHGAPA